MAALIYEKKNRVAYLTLNRPESMNAINSELRQALNEAWNDREARRPLDDLSNRDESDQYGDVLNTRAAGDHE